MGKEIKDFKIVNKDLVVTVKNSDIVIIPLEGERVEVGSYSQVTKQKIKADKIHVLKSFIENEEKNAEGQLAKLDEELKPLVNVGGIDDDVMEACKKAIGKGSKSFKDKMAVLNQRIMQIDKKKSLMNQIEYINNQLKEVKSDLKALNKIV